MIRISTASITTKAQQSITNKTAVRLLKNIYQRNKRNTVEKNEENVEKAFAIYYQINEPKNHFVLNTMIHLCIHFRSQDKVISIWNDIIPEMDNISKIQLLNCTPHSHKFDFDHVIAILEHIKTNNYNTFEKDKDRKSYSICVSKCIVNKCETLEQLQKMHSLINDDDIFIKTALIKTYGKFGSIGAAQTVFDTIEDDKKDVVVVGVMMNILMDNQYNNQVLDIYRRFNKIQNNVMDLLAIQACIKENDRNSGQLIYSDILSKYGAIESLDIKLKTALIDFHGQIENVNESIKLFDSIDDNEKTNVSVNAMMKLLVNNQCNQNALEIYEKYHWLNDHVTHLFAIKACINTDDMDKGIDIHRNKIDQNIFNQDKNNNYTIELKTMLIAFYGHFHDIQQSKMIFDSIKNEHKTMITIAEMMHAYCNCEMYQECIELYQNIENIINDEQQNMYIMCYTNVLKACTETTSYHLGQQIYDRIKNVDTKLLKDPLIQSSLINFYGKCGKLDLCQELFDSSDSKDISVYNAMINAYGRNGDVDKSMNIFNKYIKNQNECKPSRDTFTYLINSCNHAGDIKQAKSIWENEIKDVELKYDSYLVTTLIDCLSRNGQLNDAYNLLQQYDKDKLHNDKNDELMWIAVLNGCKNFNNAKLADVVHDEMKRRNLSDDTMTKALVLIRHCHTFAQQK